MAGARFVASGPGSTPVDADVLVHDCTPVELVARDSTCCFSYPLTLCFVLEQLGKCVGEGGDGPRWEEARGLPVRQYLAQPADVAGYNGLPHGHRLERLEWCHKLGDPTRQARVDDNVRGGVIIGDRAVRHWW